MRRWGPVAIYVLLILVVSSVPSLRPPDSGPGLDKLAHVIEYGILGFLLRRAITVRGVVGWLLTIGIAAVVGAVDELYQSTVPGRLSSVNDWLADLVGAAIGGLAHTIFGIRRRNYSRVRE